LPKGPLDYNTKNSGSAKLVPAPILPKIGRSRLKFPERCHLDMSTYTEFGPDRLRFAGLIPERLILGPKSNYNIGFQPTNNNA